MIKTLKLYSLSILLVLFASFLFGKNSISLSPVRATTDNKIYWCHCQPNTNCQTLHLPPSALQTAGHMDASGNPLHVGDFAGHCPGPTNTPVNTPTLTPTNTPVRTPTPTRPTCPPKDDRCLEENEECKIDDTKLCCRGLTCVADGDSRWGTCLPESTPFPTATSVPDQPTTVPTTEITPTQIPEITNTPTSQPSSGDSGSSGGGNPGAPVCHDPKPGTPANLTATWISNTQVRLNWTHASDPHSSYLVAYGPKIGDYRWGNPDIGNDNSYVISSLSRGQSYCFYVQAQNGCTPGDRSNEICVGGAVGGARVLGTTDNFNPLVVGIRESYGGEVLGTASELLGTAEVTYNHEKLPSGNILTQNEQITIDKIGLSQPIYLPQQIGDLLTVGHGEVLRDGNFFYGHNGYGVFSQLFRLSSGDRIIVANGGSVSHYQVTAKLYVDKSAVDALGAADNQIVLQTCSVTNPDSRIIIKATLL